MIDHVNATGREIWREENMILVVPPFGVLPQQYVGVPAKLVALKARVLPLLPTERPGPQRI